MKFLFNFRKKAIICVLSAVTLFSASAANAVEKYAALVIDADTGVVLHQENAGEYRYPASLVKMMTVYMAFQAIENGKLSMNQNIRVSARAAAQAPSKLGLKMGEYVTVRDALMGVIIKSANDAAVVLAEAVGGNEWQFVSMMNRMARRLGMNHTHFQNASGLPDRRQKSTAYDLARVAVALRRDYPQYYNLFAQSTYEFRGRMIYTHNRVTKGYKGADGLKTGYIRDSGFNLVTSAKRSGRRLIGVVMGGATASARDKRMVALLDQSFNKLASGQSSSKKKVLSTKATEDISPELKPDGRGDDSSDSSANDSAPIPSLKADYGQTDDGVDKAPFPMLKSDYSEDNSSDKIETAPLPVLKANYPQKEGKYKTPS